MARTVTLGGEIESRGVFGGRNWLDITVLALALISGATAFYTVGNNTWVSFLIGGIIWAFGMLVTYPAPVFLSGRSFVNYFAQWVGRKVRRFSGQNIFVPAQERQALANQRMLDDQQNPKLSEAAVNRRATARAKRWGLALPTAATKTKKSKRGSTQSSTAKKSAKKATTQRTPNAPVFIGSVRFFEFETTGGKMVIFKHMKRPGRTSKTYFSVILEVIGVPGGIMRDYEADRPYMGFGKFLAKLASRQSLVTTHQQISRTLPVDMTEHLHWASSNVVPGASEIMLSSYEELMQQVANASEQHRTFYVLNIVQSAAFRRRAALYGSGDEADARVVFEEVRKSAAWARNLGAVESVSALDESRAAALLRSLQDPNFDIDDTLSHVPGQETDLLRLTDAWQLLDWSETTDYTTANNSWLHRTGWVPADGFHADEMSVRALKGLISSEPSEPSFIRSVCLTTRLVDAKKARMIGRRDLTSDVALKKRKEKNGQVDDGTSDVKLSSSQRRMIDLKPASGHHGAHYGLFVTVSAQSIDALEAATQAMETKASACGIDRIDWLKDQQDTAFGLTLPLGRGMSEN